MPLLFILKLLALALGASYLFFRHRQRVRNWAPRNDPQEWTGHGIEVSALTPRVAQVRREYLVARQAPRGIWFHQSLVELARHAILRLGYFQHRETEQNVHNYGP
jgi:hypothetical protein